MEKYNILLGFDNITNKKQFAETFKNNLNLSGKIEINSVTLFSTREEGDKYISDGGYNVVVCREVLNDVSIGAAVLSDWKELDPNIKIILVVANEKSGGKKLENLIKRNYYDAVYWADFLAEELIIELILNGRTKKEALSYYNVVIEEAEDVEEPVIKDSGNKIPLSQLIPDAQADREVVEKEEITEESGEMVNPENMRNEIMEDVRNMWNSQNNIPDAAQSYEPTTHIVPEMRLVSNVEERKATPSIYQYKKSTVVPHEGFIVSAVSDTVLIVEVPGAHFKEQNIKNMPINLITPSN